MTGGRARLELTGESGSRSADHAASTLECLPRWPASVSMQSSLRRLPAFLVLILAACTGSDPVPPPAGPPGSPETARTNVLEAGATLLQDSGPVGGLDMHLVGFHPMKEDPHRQMEAHHFCRQVNEDFAQCALFDGSTADANLTGIEYIISEKLFDDLPAEEQSYWHPHNYEILLGKLRMPGLRLPGPTSAAYHAAMRKILVVTGRNGA